MTPFTNPAREDGLVLRHWRRKRDPNATAPLVTPTDGNELEPTTSDSKSSQTESEYYFAKFNVKVKGPKYDDAQYKEHLHSEDWSRDETDYLVNLVLDYDLRWVVIADRYDYQPTTTKDGIEPSTALIPATKKRTMEDMKARYYDVAAKIMALNRPVSSMSAAEFDLHEKMTKFNPHQETTRKQLADALLSRSLDEIKEEEILLGELKRIVNNEEKFLQERKELYDRLESPHTSGTTPLYQSSHELADLMKLLLSADKSKKRRLLLGPGDPASSSPAIGSSGQNFSGGRDVRDGHRDSISGGPSAKKNSISNPSNNTNTTNAHRPLTPKEEAKYGLTHHERLTSGVLFRHDKVVKLGQAKSNVQASKISAALTELRIPPRLVMPTARVCAEYERLIAAIHTLLDVRKVREKVEGEIRVREVVREEREGKESGGTGDGEDGGEGDGAEGEGEGVEKEEQVETPQPGEGEAEAEAEGNNGEPSKMEVEGDDDEEPSKMEEDDDDDDDNDDEQDDEQANLKAEDDDDGDAEDRIEQVADAEPDAEADANNNETASAAPSTTARVAAHKRSASVMSSVSEKSAKRQRK